MFHPPSNFRTSKTRSGRKAERIAALFLKKKGFSILERNFYCRGAELDIVARKDSLIVFVEVKSKLNEDFGRPEESVNRYKQQRLKKAATIFICSKGLEGFDCRFDVIGIIMSKKKEINHIENAF